MVNRTVNCFIFLSALFVLITFSSNVFGQVYVNVGKLTKKKGELVLLDTLASNYVSVHPIIRFFVMNEVYFFVDYGQSIESKRSFIRTREKKRKKFNSEVHLFNFMVKNGWELVFIDDYVYRFRKKNREATN